LPGGKVFRSEVETAGSGCASRSSSSTRLTAGGGETEWIGEAVAGSIPARHTWRTACAHWLPLARTRRGSASTFRKCCLPCTYVVPRVGKEDGRLESQERHCGADAQDARSSARPQLVESVAILRRVCRCCAGSRLALYRYTPPPGPIFAGSGRFQCARASARRRRGAARLSSAPIDGARPRT